VTLRWVSGIILTSLLAACVRNSDRSNAAASTFLSLEQRFADVETAWLDADVTLLSQTCSRLTPAIQVRQRQSQNANGLADYAARKTTCDRVANVRSSTQSLRKEAASIDTGDGFEELDHRLEDLRTETDALIQSFPTSSFQESNFPSAAASEYRARHGALANDAGQIALEAVNAARTASGAAMEVANASEHELDKARAHLADNAYTAASSQLQGLRGVTSAPEVLAKVVAILSTVDGAIGSAQGTATVGGNPVSAAQEALPIVSPATPTPTSTPFKFVSTNIKGGATIVNDAQRKENAIRAFYSYISQKNYAAAYSLHSANYRSGTSFEQFREGYSTTVSVDPEPHARLDGSGNVDVVLKAVDVKNGRTVYTRFVGSWHLVKNAQGMWLLDNGRFAVENS
jgi:hypothetical protein